MTSTPHLALPLLAAAQAQKHVTHNEALASLDALVQLAVKERGRNAPPANPAEGERYLVGSSATGAFASQDSKIALFDLGAWRFFSPRPGWRVYVEAENAIVVFDGTQWQDIGHYCAIIDNLKRLGVGTTPDDLNRLSAKLNAALFSALTAEEGGTGDLRFVLNKAGTGNVLSQLYQRGFSGRAEMGLIGNDDFSLRVSPDGTRWMDALYIDRSSGVASFSQGITNIQRPNLLINPAFRVNQRGFAGGALPEGVYGFDRWKGGPGGCTLSRAPDGTVTLAGALDQVIDVDHAASVTGLANLAGAVLTLSVQDPSAPLPVMIGTKTATISAGAGRRFVTVSLAGSETGHITLRLNPSSTCTFKNVKLEARPYTTPWVGDAPEDEEMSCRRYYQPLPFSGTSPMVLGCFGQRVGGSIIDIPVTLPMPMRAGPTLVTSGAAWSGASPTGNQIAFYNNNSASWTTLTGALAVTTLATPSASSLVLRLQAATSFTGSIGSLGNLYLGSSAFMALQAEL